MRVRTPGGSGAEYIPVPQSTSADALLRAHSQRLRSRAVKPFVVVAGFAAGAVVLVCITYRKPPVVAKGVQSEVIRASGIPQERKPYNILFLLTDSMDGRLLDPRSPVSEQSELPFMRSLAAQGVNFVNAYANSPICSPSRASMYSGRYPHDNKAWGLFKTFAASPGNGHQSGDWALDPACVRAYDREVCLKWAKEQNLTETWVESLIAGGMRVQIHGKIDIGANSITRFTFNDSTGYADGFHNRLNSGLWHYGRGPGLARPIKARFPDPEPVIWSAASPDGPIRRDYQTLPLCLKWLENNKNATEPWALHCSFLMPHYIEKKGYGCDNDTLSQVSESVLLPAWFTHPEEYPESAMHPYDRLMSIQKGMSEAQGNFTEEYLRKQIRCWYAYNYKVDQLLGSVWSKAAETGNLDNTIVVYASDHGDMAMQHRQTLKNSLREPSARVPLIIAGPGSKPHLKATREEFEGGQLVPDLVSLLDIYPTLVDAAGVKPPSFLAGESILPYLWGTGRKKQDYVVAMYSTIFAGTNQFMFRRGPWKYLVYGQYGPELYKDYGPQLFNLDSDPDELHNVASQNPRMVHYLDASLREVLDYEQIDREIKIEDKAIYRRFYADPLIGQQQQLRMDWDRAFQGFNDQDEVLVQEWLDSV